MQASKQPGKERNKQQKEKKPAELVLQYKTNTYKYIQPIHSVLHGRQSSTNRCRDTDCLVKTPLHAHYNHYTPLLRILIHTPQYFHSHTHCHIRIRQCNHTMQFTYCLIRLCSTNCLPLDPFELYQHHCRSNYTPILYKTHI